MMRAIRQMTPNWWDYTALDHKLRAAVTET